jgi:hypothetical protein
MLLHFIFVMYIIHLSDESGEIRSRSAHVISHGLP